MPLKLQVDDPHNLLIQIFLIEESNRSIIIGGNMSSAGKRAWVTPEDGGVDVYATVDRAGDDVDYAKCAKIRLIDPPFVDWYRVHEGCSKYALWIVLASQKAMEEPLNRSEFPLA